MGWATVKQRAEQLTGIDWWAEWRWVAQGVEGEYPNATVADILEFLMQMDQAYEAKDLPQWHDLKAQLVKQPWWRGSKPSSAPFLSASSTKSTAPSTAAANPTLWAAIEAGTSPSSASSADSDPPPSS